MTPGEVKQESGDNEVFHTFQQRLFLGHSLALGSHPLEQWSHGIQWTQTTASTPFEKNHQLKLALRGMAPGP